METLQTGTIVKTVGLKGELKLKSTTFFAEQRYQEGNIVYLSKDGENHQKFTVVSYRSYQGFDFIYLKEISSIEVAEKYIGYGVYINKEDAIDIQNASKFHIDSSVFCVELFGADILMRSRMDELGIICGGEMLYIVVTTFDEPRNIIVGTKYCIRIHSQKQIQIPIKSYRLTTVGKDIFSLANVDNAKFAIRLANHLNREGVDKVELFKIIKYDGEKYTLSTEDLFCKYQDLAKYENELE